MAARTAATATVTTVILLSSMRPEAVATLIVLPRGARLLAVFADDASTRDLTEQAADLITEYLLRGGGAESETSRDTVEVARVELSHGDPSTVRMALIDLRTDLVEEVPGERLLPLLSGAISMAVSEAVSEAGATEWGAGDSATPVDGATP